MGLGCSGEILLSPSPSPPSPTWIWEMGSSRVSLRNRSFRSARIDPSRRAIAEGYMYVIKNHIKKPNIKKELKKSKTAENRHSIKIPYRNIPHSYPLKGAVMYLCCVAFTVRAHCQMCQAACYFLFNSCPLKGIGVRDISIGDFYAMLVLAVFELFSTLFGYLIFSYDNCS